MRSLFSALASGSGLRQRPVGVYLSFTTTEQQWTFAASFLMRFTSFGDRSANPRTLVLFAIHVAPAVRVPTRAAESFPRMKVTLRHEHF